MTSLGGAAQGRPTRFESDAGHHLRIYLAPAGTTHFGPNHAKNDKDGTVDHDERLRITGVEPGMYDAKFTDVRPHLRGGNIKI